MHPESSQNRDQIQLGFYVFIYFVESRLVFSVLAGATTEILEKIVSEIGYRDGEHGSGFVLGIDFGHCLNRYIRAFVSIPSVKLVSYKCCHLHVRKLAH